MIVLRTDLEGVAGKEVQVVGEKSNARLVKFESPLRHQADTSHEQMSASRTEEGGSRLGI